MVVLKKPIFKDEVAFCLRFVHGIGILVDKVMLATRFVHGIGVLVDKV